MKAIPTEAKQTASEGKSAPRVRSRRKLSAEARKRISDAQKARWAKHRGESGRTAKSRKIGLPLANTR